MQQPSDTFFFGVHFMVDGYGAPATVLKDRGALERALHTIPEQMGMYAITEPTIAEVGPNNKKDPGGLSGVILIAESHISFHTFPARGFITIDVYTCQNTLDTARLLSILKETFQFTHEETYHIDRGRSYPSHNTQTD